MKKFKDIILLIFSALLVFVLFFLGTHFVGKSFLNYAVLMGFSYGMPHIRWRGENRRTPIPKMYFFVSGTFCFLVYLILWKIHGDRGPLPINIVDVILAIIIWAIFDSQVRKIFKIKRTDTY